MRKILLWLLVPALPIAVVFGILALQDPPVPARAIAPVEVLPAEPAAPELRQHQFSLLRSDGSPAADGVVIVLEPAVAQAAVAADGACRFALRASGPIRVLAWAPGHRVREAGPWLSPPLELRLDASEQPEPPDPPLRLTRLTLRLKRPGGEALAGALLLARAADDPEAPPWLAFADEHGRVDCEVEETELLLQVFAPGRAPRAAWLLASGTRTPSATEAEWEIPSAQLEVGGLPPMEPLQLWRDGEVLDLRAAGEDGFVRWDALAPGAWELSAAAGRMRLILAAGAHRVTWTPAAGS